VAFIGQLPKSFRCRAPTPHNRPVNQGMHTLHTRAGNDNLNRRSEVTQILDAIGHNDGQAFKQLLPIISQEPDGWLPTP
jgi:hypothetical protein